MLSRGLAHAVAPLHPLLREQQPAQGRSRPCDHLPEALWALGAGLQRLCDNLAARNGCKIVLAMPSLLRTDIPLPCSGHRVHTFGCIHTCIITVITLGCVSVCTWVHMGAAVPLPPVLVTWATVTVSLEHVPAQCFLGHLECMHAACLQARRSSRYVESSVKKMLKLTSWCSSLVPPDRE